MTGWRVNLTYTAQLSAALNSPHLNRGLGLGFRVWVWGSGFVGFAVWGLGFGVLGVGPLQISAVPASHIPSAMNPNEPNALGPIVDTSPCDTVMPYMRMSKKQEPLWRLLITRIVVHDGMYWACLFQKLPNQKLQRQITIMVWTINMRKHSCKPWLDTPNLNPLNPTTGLHDLSTVS